MSGMQGSGRAPTRQRKVPTLGDGGRVETGRTSVAGMGDVDGNVDRAGTLHSGIGPGLTLTPEAREVRPFCIANYVMRSANVPMTTASGLRMMLAIRRFDARPCTCSGCDRFVKDVEGFGRP